MGKRVSNQIMQISVVVEVAMEIVMGCWINILPTIANTWKENRVKGR
jgi:hypothetical protein